MVQRIKMTASEYLALPETNLPRHLIDGEVFEMTAPELEHQDVVGNIFVLFKRVAREINGKAYVAPVDIEFDAENIVQPDTFLLLADSRCLPIGTKRLSGPPDIIAEVLSPSTAQFDRREKFRLYERHGVREYWIAEPRDQLVTVWQLHDDSFVLLDVYGRDEKFISTLIGEVDCSAIFEG
jgi:Uma2 family endonuclease